MKKSILFLAGLIIIKTQPLFAQVQWQVKAGAAVSTVRGQSMTLLNNAVELTNGMVSQQPLTGFYAGAGVILPVSDVISIVPALQYAQTGTTFQGDLGVKALNFLGIGARASLVQHQVELPVMVQAKVAEGFSIKAGPALSYNVDNSLRVRATALGINLYRQSLPLGNNFTEPLQVSAMGGLQYQSKGGIGVEAVYQHGITRLNSMVNAFPQSVRVGITYRF